MFKVCLALLIVAVDCYEHPQHHHYHHHTSSSWSDSGEVDCYEHHQHHHYHHYTSSWSDGGELECYDHHHHHDHHQHTPSWSYIDALGPSHWCTIQGSSCGGHFQSPINIHTEYTVEKDFGKFILKDDDVKEHDAGHPVTITNNGHSAEVTLIGKYELSGGGLYSTYVAEQLHFHWGSQADRGSEHTINGNHFPAEMHIVHTNGSHFAVLAVFLQIGDFENKHFQSICRGLRNILYEGDVFYFDDVFSVRDLLPKNITSYYRYHGSLTIPPCSETVTWTIFEEPVTISQTQFKMFRDLFEDKMEDGSESYAHHHLVDNYRPVQPLNGRTVYYSD